MIARRIGIQFQGRLRAAVVSAGSGLGNAFGVMIGGNTLVSDWKRTPAELPI
jgi:hypothetical protein